MYRVRHTDKQLEEEKKKKSMRKVSSYSAQKYFLCAVPAPLNTIHNTVGAVQSMPANCHLLHKLEFHGESTLWESPWELRLTTRKKNRTKAFIGFDIVR